MTTGTDEYEASGAAAETDGERTRTTPSPRASATALLGVSAVVLLALASMLPVPYAVMRPGPVRDVLGESGGSPLISIEGRETYETAGSLDLLTVSIEGGPGRGVDLTDVVGAWLDDKASVRPERELFPAELTEEDVDRESSAEMVTSQENATAAALAELDIPVPTTLTVVGFTEGSRAVDLLQDGDVITAVGGQAVTDLPGLRDVLQDSDPGAEVAIDLTREGTPTTVRITTLEGSDGQTLMGVLIDPTYHFPFDVNIKIENIGGPSAGMMFSLGIIDKLTPGAMTGGEKVAGTGTVDSDGAVGAIGGVQQKLVGAQRAGASWFLAPEGNCDEVAGHVPDGLRVVRVATLEEARAAVEAIGSGRATDALPTCETD